MRRGLLGSIAALAAGAGSAWGQQPPAPIAPAGGAPAAVRAGDVVPASGGGPAPVIMPPVTVGPPGDPLGLGPTAGLGPPPGPMYPPPGPYGAPMFQPPPSDNGLGGGAGNGCGPVAPRFWFDGEYLLWFAKDQPIGFPLLTTSAPAQNGLLGASSTIQLVPGHDINYNAISGFRLTTGFYGDADRRFGAMVSGFYTEQKRITQNFSTQLPGTSVGIPLLARPFIDTDTGLSSLVLTNAGLGVGTASVSTSTQTWGVEATAVWNLFRSAPGGGGWGSLDFFAGYKYLQVREDLKIESFSTLTGVEVIPIFQIGPFGVPIQVGVRIVPINNVAVGGVITGAPATVQVVDRFVATNQFNGGVFGFRQEYHYGMWNLTGIAKIGIGNMHQILEIQGATTFANPLAGTSGSTYGGLFANSSNIGRFVKDTFAVIPEFTLNVGLNVTRRVSVFAGYNFMYVSRVIRPGNQINPVVDSSTIPFSATFGESGHTPAVQRLFAETDFWIQGANFGLSVRY
jgi:Putative beta barrel porin-7 (BBP7)